MEVAYGWGGTEDSAQCQENEQGQERAKGIVGLQWTVPTECVNHDRICHGVTSHIHTLFRVFVAGCYPLGTHATSTCPVPYPYWMQTEMLFNLFICLVLDHTIITVQHRSINQNNYSYAGILLLKEDYQCCHQISFRYIDCILPTTKVFHRVKLTRALDICLLPRVKGGYASIAQYVVSPANPPR